MTEEEIRHEILKVALVALVTVLLVLLYQVLKDPGEVVDDTNPQLGGQLSITNVGESLLDNVVENGTTWRYLGEPAPAIYYLPKVPPVTPGQILDFEEGDSILFWVSVEGDLDPETIVWETLNGELIKLSDLKKQEKK